MGELHPTFGEAIESHLLEAARRIERARTALAAADTTQLAISMGAAVHSIEQAMDLYGNVSREALTQVVGK